MCSNICRTEVDRSSAEVDGGESGPLLQGSSPVGALTVLRGRGAGMCMSSATPGAHASSSSDEWRGVCRFWAVARSRVGERGCRGGAVRGLDGADRVVLVKLPSSPAPNRVGLLFETGSDFFLLGVSRC